MLRGAYGYGTCLSKLVSHPCFTNHTYGTQEEEEYYIICSIIIIIDRCICCYDRLKVFETVNMGMSYAHFIAPSWQLGIGKINIKRLREHLCFPLLLGPKCGGSTGWRFVHLHHAAISRGPFRPQLHLAPWAAVGSRAPHGPIDWRIFLGAPRSAVASQDHVCRVYCFFFFMMLKLVKNRNCAINEWCGKWILWEWGEVQWVW